jgi:hypothetical protein
MVFYKEHGIINESTSPIYLNQMGDAEIIRHTVITFVKSLVRVGVSNFQRWGEAILTYLWCFK